MGTSETGLDRRVSGWNPAGRSRYPVPRAGRRPSLLGDADLLALQGGVVKGGDDDELVAVPLGGLAELEVERLSGRGDHSTVGQGHLPGEGPGGVGDDGDPVAAAELDRVRVAVHVHVGEDA